MVPRSTVGTLQVVDLLTALRVLGLNTTDLCRRVGLRASLLQDPTASVPARVVVDLLAVAARRSGDPLVGLHAGEHTQPRGPLYYLVMSSPQLGDGLRQVTRFSRLAVDTLRIHVKRGPDTNESSSATAVTSVAPYIVVGLASAQSGGQAVRWLTW